MKKTLVSAVLGAGLLVTSPSWAVIAVGTTYTFTGANSTVWSDPGNWSPVGTPTSGDSVILPGSNTNNDIAGLTLQRIAIGSGGGISGQALGVTQGITANSGFAFIGAPLDLGGNTVVFDTAPGQAALFAVQSIAGNGTLILRNDTNLQGSSAFSGTIEMDCASGTCGTLRLVGGSVPATVIATNTLSGTGSVGSLFAPGQVSPDGGDISTLDATFQAGGGFFPTLGATASKLNVTGTVQIESTTAMNFNTTSGFAPTAGQVYTIIANDGNDAVIGTFANKPEGGFVTQVGNYTFVISYVGGDGNDVTLTAIAAQAITFGAPAGHVYGDAPFTVSATGGGSGNPVTFSSQSTGVCTTGGANGADVTIVAPGTCTIAANQAAGSGYSAAPQVTQSFTVAKAPQNIVFGGFANKVFGDAPFTASATGGGSGNPVTFASTTTAVCTTTGTNGTTVTIVGAGTCTIDIAQQGNANYNASETLQGFTVSKATQQITFATLPNRVIGSGSFTVSATPGASTSPVTFSSSTTAVCTTSGTNGSTVNLVSPGLCLITANQAGDANYNAASPITSGFNVTGVLVDARADYFSDFNADSKADIAWVNTDGSAALWLMNANQQAGGGRLFGAGTGWSIKLVADFDGDGKADILWQHTDGRVAMWLMDGARQVGGAVLLPAGTGYTPKLAGDFNRDGKADILWERTDGSSALWLMNGTTQIGGGRLFGGGTGWSAQLVGDFNGDGMSDILWTHTDGRTATWLMNGATQVGGGVLLAAGTGWTPRLLGDFNGDGKADIVWQHTDGRTAMWLMNGITQVGGGQLLGAGTGWSVTRVGDANGDRKADLVWQKSDGTIALWLMNGATQVGGGQLAQAGTGWKVVRMADFSGDGNSDLLVVNTDGTVQMWLLNGASVAPATLLPAGTGWTPAP